MNFFEQELRNLFHELPEFKDAKYIGRSCIVPIDNELKIKAEFITCGVMDNYEALKLTAINRSDGKVDQLTLHFSDYFQKVKIFGNLRTPYIWIYNGTPKWYQEPAPSDKEALADAACKYIGVFTQQNNLRMEF